jgi:hypothetical protein
MVVAVSVHLIPSGDVKMALQNPGYTAAPATHIVPFHAKATIPFLGGDDEIHLIPS